MDIYYAVISFVFGTVVGSFLNVCIYRIPRHESISFPPSHCTNCGNMIKLQHLIPIISYIFLRGKCAYCGSKISLRYPTIEFINGLLWCTIFLIFKSTFITFFLMPVSSVVLVLVMIFYDKKSY